jgi:hypothetical protein
LRAGDRGATLASVHGSKGPLPSGPEITYHWLSLLDSSGEYPWHLG